MNFIRYCRIAFLLTLVLGAFWTVSSQAQTPTSQQHSPSQTVTESFSVHDLENHPVPKLDYRRDNFAGDPAAGPDLSSDANTRRLNMISKTKADETSGSPQVTDPDAWQFQLTPYLWIASISGRGGIGNVVVDTDTSVTDTGVELNFGFMSVFEARKDKFVILADLEYSDLSTEKGNPGPLFSSTRASFKTFIFDPEVGYRILDNERGAFVDVLGGVRIWHVNGDLQFRAGILPALEVSRSRSWVDGIAGLRGKAALSERWFVTGKADLGGGGSNFTYQLFGGVGVNVGQRLALIGGYRDLNVNYNKDGFLFDMSLHGPILGFGIKF